MEKIGNDFRKLLPIFKDMNIKLADRFGNGGYNDITITNTEIAFNGATHCWHNKTKLTIPWPSKDASGIAQNDEDHIVGDWFAGHVIDTRVCNGDCSYESFIFSNEKTKFRFCKTAYRPYDLAVNCVLLIAKYYLGNNIIVKTDGLTQHWKDANELCNKVLNYNISVEVVNGIVTIS
jgi:hypothetical protein